MKTEIIDWIEILEAENKALKSSNVKLILQARRLRESLESTLNILEPEKLRIIQKDLCKLNHLTINQNAQFEFNNETQRYSFVSAIEVPWHKCGQIFNHVFTAKEGIEFGGLDFIVEKQKLITERGLDVPDYFATVREDNNDVLGMVGKDYTIVQNRDVFSFFDGIVGAGTAIYETAGCL